MSIGGGSSKNTPSGLDTNLQQGSFNFGPTQFDLGNIAQMVAENTGATDARYKQLGLGGSTMNQQDDAQQQLLGSAVTGQEQTQQVTDPALNPALQSAQTNLPTSAILAAENPQGSGGGTSIGSILGGVASLGGLFG